MRKFRVLIMFALCNTFALAQSVVDDFDFNRPKNACYINNVFVKSYIGFDLGKNSGITYVQKSIPLDKPITINNITYYDKTILTCEKKINFTTLEEIRKNKFPDITEVVMFMIDNYFIMTDAQSYKLDADYIAKCELLSSKDFDAFKDQPVFFSIIRVFTKRMDKEISTRLR